MPEQKHSREEIPSPDTQRKLRVPPGQHLVRDWPVLHAGPVPKIDPSAWTLRIFGMVKKEKRLSLQDFMELPTVTVRSDIHCVTTWSLLDNIWEGVGAEAIREICPPLPPAKFVVVHAAGDWTTNLPLEDFFQPDVLFAVKHNGRPIPPEHGAPVRLVVPRLYFWKSAKWVTGIEYLEKEQPGFWESRGYHIHGDPWKEERYSD